MDTASGGLRRSLQDRLLNGMIRKVGSEANKWKVLVVDRESLRILSAALQVNELVNEGITIVEMLDMRREPLPRIPALYFVTPSAESVQQLASESPMQYKEFHLFFTSRLPDFQMDVLRGNMDMLRRVRALVELDVAFLALESRLFSLGRPGASLPQLHAEDDDSREEMATISERLAEACKIVAPSVDWTVRSDATSSSSKTVASLVKEQLETARIERRSNKEKEQQINTNAGEVALDEESHISKATLLVVDRVADLVSPLVHEYSYQAMAHDLLQLNYRKPGGAHLEVPNEKDDKDSNFVQLDDEEKDPVWTTIRFMFIEEALAKAQVCFKEFLETDAAFRIRGIDAGDVDIKDMSAAVRALPDSQMRADKHALHIRAAKECLEVCSRDGLTDLSLVEQDLVMGRYSDASKIRPEVMMESIITVLMDKRIPSAHRLRLALIARIIAEGLPGLGRESSALAGSASFRSKVLRGEIRHVGDVDALSESSLAGLERILDAAKSGLRSYEAKRNPHSDLDDKDTVTGKLIQKYAHRQYTKQQKKDNAIRRRRHGLHQEGELEYDVARYHPPLRSIMMDLVDDELDKDSFPLIGSVSVDSIIASLGESSVSESYTSERPSRPSDKLGLHHGAATIRSHSASVAGIVKSLGKGDSSHSGGSEDDRFRIAESGHLFMVFVVGGVCYSEVRAMYEVCAKREANLLIGGSAVLTPGAFVEALGAVADPVLRIRVLLPPLPIELAMSRAARARAIEAGRRKASKCHGVDKGMAHTDESSAGGVVGEESQQPFREGSEKEGEVEVVVGYKKSRGLRLFGRKKR